MVSSMWNAIFDYADKKKEEGNEKAVEIAHEIEDVMQDAYDKSISLTRNVRLRNPQTDLEECIFSLPGLKRKLDKSDNSEYFTYNHMNYENCKTLFKEIMGVYLEANNLMNNYREEIKDLKVKNANLARKVKNLEADHKALKSSLLAISGKKGVKK